MTPLYQRFIAYTKLNPDTGCLIWTGPVNSGGRGALKVGKVKMPARAISLTIAGSPAPKGQAIYPTCGNAACVALDHLRVGASARVDVGVRIARNSITDPETGCQNWTGIRDRGGYARMKIDGRRVKVSRVVVERQSGRPISKGKQALHSCDNPACVAADHLRVGTPAENMTDMANKGRCHRGPRDPLLPPSTARERDVMLLLNEGGLSQKIIAETYGFGIGTISLCIKRARATRAALQLAA